MSYLGNVQHFSISLNKASTVYIKLSSVSASKAKFIHPKTRYFKLSIAIDVIIQQLIMSLQRYLLR